ncbi:MAG TPA: hypothetical protein PLF30_00100 [Candidatus Moranbacteria bacterium]|jgi:uncharacterized protein YneF (UPF0154 family)|nr:hypothetical protein [Candidatus Moranbacteria bacterium]HPX93958.1 hypothetical protein [Candidatus Moranbacteria bacterium]HQB59315.1 hypothetical protein [Candidatus Moranbacteria bacterium]
MEEHTPEAQAAEKLEQVKRWFQDNLRIIISVAIVVLIAGGIYSYSKRGENPVIEEQAQIESTEEIADISAVSDSDEADQQTVSEGTAKPEVSSTSTSKETEGAFVETAGQGDGLTHLARRATANYLEKNPDSSLTKEHKIYIEDYLRKNAKHAGGVHVGTSIEFSKDLIQKAIEQSKSLNESQLQNLQKYSARVTSI